MRLNALGASFHKVQSDLDYPESSENWGQFLESLGDGVYLRLGAYRFIVPLGWPLVRDFWAVNRINTVIVQ